MVTPASVNASRKLAEPARLAYAWLTVNRRCNFRCQWCYAQGTNFAKQEEMTLGLATKLTQVLVDAGIHHLFVTGGEPTLWSPLTRFNAFCQSIGLETTLVTNAMRFGDDVFWQKYQKHPNTFVGVSVKAGNPKQLYTTAKVKRFDLVTKGISRAMDYFHSGVGIVYNSHYADNLIEMTEYAMTACHSNTVKIDFCTPVFVEEKPLPNCVMHPTQLVANIMRDYRRLEEITSGRLSFIMSIPFCFWPKEFIQELKAKDRVESVCHLIKREGIVVDSDGSLCMCNELFDFPIGKYLVDFCDSDTLLEFLNRPEINGYYNEMTRYPSNRCQECSWYQDCGGGCPLQWSVHDPEQFVHPI